MDIKLRSSDRDPVMYDADIIPKRGDVVEFYDEEIAFEVMFVKHIVKRGQLSYVACECKNL